MEPPPPPSREEAPAEKRPLDAAEDPAEVAAKKQRLADPSSPIDPKDVEGLKDEHRQDAIAQREAAAKAKIQAEAEEREQKRAAEAKAAADAKAAPRRRAFFASPSGPRPLSERPVFGWARGTPTKPGRTGRGRGVAL